MKISRRDFLKLYAAFMASAGLSGASRALSTAHSDNIGKPSILILVFDAMSARHLSLYGYARETTPNLKKFAERASVYHRPYSAGNFTTPGTASMLTGLQPWTHRAINFRGMIDRNLTDRNLFNLVGDEYTRFAFTQNFWADILLSQFENDLDLHLPCEAFSRAVHSLFQPDDILGDRAIGYYVFQDFLNFRRLDPDQFPGSLFITSAELTRTLTSDRDKTSVDYPRGLPGNYEFSYENRSVLTGVGRLVQDAMFQSAPCLAYLHFWSPHDPYNARKDFIGIFRDNLKLHSKPRHPLAGSRNSERGMREYL